MFQTAVAEKIKTLFCIIPYKPTKCTLFHPLDCLH